MATTTGQRTGRSSFAALTLLFAFFVQHLIAAPTPKSCSSDATEYDFIIVGGGTAGLALATRLSQQLDDCILVIEAGPSALSEPNINIPGKKGSTIGTKYDWNFTTVAQPGALDRVFTTTRGKVLGGSSALNLMTWDRGSTVDYDAWQELGSPGWNWPNMIHNMLKVETFTGANTSTYGIQGVGHHGPIDTVINRVIPTQQDTWIPTLQGLGIPHNLESLGGNPIGVMDQPSNINPANYTRSYSANAYLPLARSNLKVLVNTTVAKVNLSKSYNGTLTANGVTLSSGAVLSAAKEVILSAGSVQSPQLLELSGIGQSSVLSAAGVPVLLDLPGVGENLQDHLRVENSYQLKPNYTSFDFLKNATYAAQQLALYDENKVSEWDYTGSGYAYLNWQQVLGNDSALVALARGIAQANNTVDQKKLEYLTTKRGQTVGQLEVIFSDGYTGVKGYPTNTSALYGKGFFTLIGVINHPFSRGSIHINASNPTGKPVINPNYASNEYDIQSLIEAAKFNRKIATSAPMSGVWLNEYEPGLNVTTDAQWREYVLSTALSIYHPLGTCALLPRKDDGVVDPLLKVYGTSNLRVVDASIIPILPTAHLQTGVYGIAERAADLIIARWK